MKNIVKILKLGRPLYGLMILLGVLIILSACLDLISPLLSKSIVDQIVLNVQGKNGNVTVLLYFIAAVFVLQIIHLITTVVSERLGDHFSGKLKKFLTEKYYAKVLTLRQSHFDSELSGKMVHQLNRGIVSIQDFINTATNFILPSLLQTIFTVGIMLYYNVYIALFTFLLFPVYLGISFYSVNRWGSHEVEKNKFEDSIRGRIQEVISNIKLVKSFTTEKKEYATLSDNLTTINDIYAVQSREFHIFDFIRGLSLIVIFTIINVILFYNTFQGELSIGEMVLILQLINQIQRPLFAMSYILTQIQRAESGSKEFFEVLELPSIEIYDSVKKVNKMKDPTISFEHVNFNYDTSEKILEDVSFEIKKQEKVALVGHSGAGKSTIINLILKFYTQSGGSIYMKDQSYENLDYSFVRQNIALVFQENELFSSTIRENVSYGSEPTEKEIIKALKMANAYEFVMKLPGGLDAQIGERGVRLSGGQKQRIQIARAIIKDAPILILDEATSSLDAKSEKEVQEALENLMEKKLVIIIAHRFSTIQNVNKILVIDGGKIIDSGTPQELSTKPGVYSSLLNYQIEGNKKLLESFEIY